MSIVNIHITKLYQAVIENATVYFETRKSKYCKYEENVWQIKLFKLDRWDMFVWPWSKHCVHHVKCSA